MTSLVDTTRGHVQEPKDLELLVEGGAVLRHDVDALNSALLDLVLAVNGRLSLGAAGNGERVGNLDAQFLLVTTSTADTDVAVLHGLGRVPVGYWVVGKDKAGVVYDSGRESWTDTRLTVRCSVATVKVRLVVF